MIHERQIRSFLPACCDAAFLRLEEYSGKEADAIKKKYPESRTVLVLGHHIANSLEWIWYEFPAERRENTCAADLHLKEVSGRVEFHLRQQGFFAESIPYPGSSGIQFKVLAADSGLGQLGDNFLLLHREWGPWIHLRAMVTDADIVYNEKERGEDICLHCGLCIQACPGLVFANGGFDGLTCDRTQEELAKEHKIPGAIFKCEHCVRACPVGEQPAG